MKGRLTYPGLLGEAESRQRVGELIDRACAAVAPLGESAANLEAMARLVAERDR